LYTGSVAKIITTVAWQREGPKQFYRTNVFFHVSKVWPGSFSCKKVSRKEGLVSRGSSRGTRWSTDVILMDWIHVAEDRALRRAPCEHGNEPSGSHTPKVYEQIAGCDLRGVLRFQNGSCLARTQIKIHNNENKTTNSNLNKMIKNN
jgi:hypothetical protein